MVFNLFKGIRVLLGSKRIQMVPLTSNIVLNFARDLLILFDDFTQGSELICKDNIRKAFNSIHLYPSTAQGNICNLIILDYACVCERMLLQESFGRLMITHTRIY